MSFVEAIRSCFRQYVGFSGRAGRSELWWFFLFLVVVWAVAYVINPNVAALVLIATVLPDLAVQARRLHDIGRSGWWMLLNLVPFGFFVTLYWYVQPSVSAPNQYGPPPGMSMEAGMMAPPPAPPAAPPAGGGNGDQG